MADKINLTEAAKILNIDVERLQFLARTGEIHGIKDADQTAFTYQELLRYADSSGIDIPDVHASDSSNLFDDDSVLVAETPVSPAAGGSGTIIGDEASVNPHDSDLNLADSLELEIDDSDDLSLDLEEGDLDPDDKTMFAGDDSAGLSAADLAALSLDLDDEGAIASDDDTQFGVGEESDLMGEEVLNLDLGGSSDDETQFAIGNDGFKVAEDELVLGGEEMPLDAAAGSDVALTAGNSGINLSSPHDSGIGLEGDVLDLSAESGSSLELPGVDDEFILGGKPDDEMSDSGSQVIALSDSIAFGDDGGTIVQPEVAEDPFAIPPADPFAVPDPAMQADPFALPPEQTPPEPEMVAGSDVLAPVMQEASYGFFNVFSLFMVFVMQVAIFVMLIDLVKNLWGHHAETPSEISTMLIKSAGELKNGQNAWMVLSIAACVFFIAIIVGWILDRSRNK
ncbi:MAG: helix-turn-helix domain-containing protein [Planctomycetota bacterium]|nr:helix-turn-helix domain-containing protein [Planctomycetota bacterium]